MTISTVLLNTYGVTVIPIVFIWLLIVILVAVVELLNLAKSYIEDNDEHIPWMYWAIDRWPWKHFQPKNMRITEYNHNAFWLGHWVNNTVIVLGLAMLLWPIVMSLCTFLGVIRGLRWCFRLKKKVETIDERCLKNHDIKPYIDMEDNYSN